MRGVLGGVRGVLVLGDWGILGRPLGVVLEDGGLPREPLPPLPLDFLCRADLGVAVLALGLPALGTVSREAGRCLFPSPVARKESRLACERLRLRERPEAGLGRGSRDTEEGPKLNFRTYSSCKTE